MKRVYFLGCTFMRLLFSDRPGGCYGLWWYPVLSPGMGYSVSLVITPTLPEFVIAHGGIRGGGGRGEVTIPAWVLYPVNYDTFILNVNPFQGANWVVSEQKMT